MDDIPTPPSEVPEGKPATIVVADKISLEVLEKYSVENNTLSMDVKNDPKDSIQIEIGDSKQGDFKPQVKIMRWDNEVNFSIRAQEEAGAVVQFDGEKIKYVAEKYEVHQYDKPDAGEDGGFEFEWVIKMRPQSNVFVATTQYKNVVGLKQFPLNQEIPDPNWVIVTETQAFDKDGNLLDERPEDIVNSIAFYHDSKGGMNDEHGMDYKTGKIAHCKRIKATDNNGNWVWGDQEWDAENNEFRAIVPQDFIDAIDFENGGWMKVDPTFGYTTAGTSGGYSLTANEIGATKFTAAAENGSVTSVSVYGAAASSGSGVVRSAFYSDSSGVPNSLLASDSGEVTINSETQQWWNWNLSYSFTASQVIWIANYQGSGTGFRIQYDSGTTNQNAEIFGAGTYPTFPSTMGTPTFYQNRKYSKYATYTASAGDLSVNVNDTVSITESVTIRLVSYVSVHDDPNISEFVNVNEVDNVLFDGSQDTGRGMRWGIKIKDF